jgi:CBS domain-containing protein
MDPNRILLTASQVMQRQVFTLAQDLMVLDAVRELLHRGFAGAPVLDGNQLVGVFSERDALAALAAAHYDAEPPGTVGQHMRRDFPVVGLGTDLFELATAFRDHGVRWLPVVDAQRRILGLVTRTAALVALQRQYEHRDKTQYERLQEHMAQHHGSG